MGNETKKDLMQEIELQKATIYNLRLYLSAAIKAAPHLKRYLETHFEGLPGFIEEPEK